AVCVFPGATRNHELLLVLAIPTLLLGGATAGYSALLFGQAEGRDFWQSALVLPHLLVSALVAGAAALSVVGVLIGGMTAGALWSLTVLLMLGLLLHAVLLVAELGASHPNLDAARAAHLITRAWRGRFWGVVVV